MGKGFLSLSHARALVVASRDDASLAPATPTQVVRYSPKNRRYFFAFFRRAGASARRARNARHARRDRTLNRKDQVSVEYDI